MASGNSAFRAIKDLMQPQRMGCEVYIDNRRISPVLKLTIRQYIGRHNELLMHFKHEVVQEIGLFVIEDAQALLGRLTEVSIFDMSDPNDSPFQNKFVITEVKLVNDGLAEGVLELRGLSPTVLLDGARHFESFATQNLATIVNTLCKPMESMRTYAINTLRTNPLLEYTSRYNETAWNYLKRLADATGNWIYCNGTGLVFGAAKNESPAPLVYGSDCTKVSMSLLTVPVQSSIFDYEAGGNRAMNQNAGDYNGNIGSTARDAYKRSARLYSGESAVPMQTFQAGQEILSEKAMAVAASKVAGSYIMEAETDNFRLGIGTLVDFEFKRLGESSVHPQMRIVYTEHTLLINGMYSNSFKAVPSGAETPPQLDFEQPRTFPMLARVLSNADSLNQGRVQVAFIGWVHDRKSRYERQITDWIRVLSPDAGSSRLVGQNRGFVFVPEVNDQVMVDFENGNPDRPFVTGSAFHGQIAAGGGNENHLKTIVTRSGHTIEFDDALDMDKTNWGITIKDSQGNKIHMDTKGKNLTFSSPETITFEANNLNINIKKDMNINVGESILSKSKDIALKADNKSLIAGKKVGILGKEKLAVYGGQAQMFGRSKVEIASPNTVFTQLGYSPDGESENEQSRADSSYLHFAALSKDDAIISTSEIKEECWKEVRSQLKQQIKDWCQDMRDKTNEWVTDMTLNKEDDGKIDAFKYTSILTKVFGVSTPYAFAIQIGTNVIEKISISLASSKNKSVNISDFRDIMVNALKKVADDDLSVENVLAMYKVFCAINQYKTCAEVKEHTKLAILYLPTEEQWYQTLCIGWIHASVDSDFWDDGWSWDDVAGLITINASFFDKIYTIAGTSKEESWDITSVEFDNDVCRPKGIAYCLKRAFQQKEKYNLLKLPIDMKVILQNGSQSGISKYDGMMTIAYRTGNQSTWKIDYGNKLMFENFLGYINKIPITVNKLK